MGWAFLFMFVVLKVPVAAAMWLIWWAVREEPPVAPDPSNDGGGTRAPRHPRRPSPRPPRRGPHAAAAPPAPRRVRIARGRSLTAR